MIRTLSILLVAAMAVTFTANCQAQATNQFTVQDPDYNPKNPDDALDVSNFIQFQGGYEVKFTGRRATYTMANDAILNKLVEACRRGAKRVVIAYVKVNGKRVIRGVAF